MCNKNISFRIKSDTSMFQRNLKNFKEYFDNYQDNKIIAIMLDRIIGTCHCIKEDIKMMDIKHYNNIYANILQLVRNVCCHPFVGYQCLSHSLSGSEFVS